MLGRFLEVTGAFFNISDLSQNLLFQITKGFLEGTVAPWKTVTFKVYENKHVKHLLHRCGKKNVHSTCTL